MQVLVVSTLLLGWSVLTALGMPFNHHFPQGLNKITQHKGKLWFGMVTGYPTKVETNDTRYMEVLGNHNNWGQLTSRNYMKVCYIILDVVMQSTSHTVWLNSSNHY